MSNPQPPSGDDPGESGESSPEQPPAYGQEPPAEQPPAYGDPNPAYGQQPPPDQPPAYGQQPPPYGQDPNPAYGQQPPPEYGAYGGGQQPPPPGYGGYGGYGGEQPPPPGYGGGYGQPLQFRVGDAISYGWKKFTGNWVPWVVVSLLFFIIQGIVQGISAASQSGSDRAWDSGYTLGAGSLSFVALILSLLATLVSWAMQAAQTRGALQETEGRKPAIGDFFQWGDRAGSVILTFLLLGVLTFIGVLLCVLPGIIFAFFSWYTLWFVLDRGSSPIQALQDSFKLVGSNFGPVLLLALALIGINIIGVILCFVGLLVTVPLTLIATGYSYKVLTGQPAV